MLTTVLFSLTESSSTIAIIVVVVVVIVVVLLGAVGGWFYYACSHAESSSGVWLNEVSFGWRGLNNFDLGKIY